MNNSRPYFIVNVEAAIYRNGSYLIIQRGMIEEHAAGALSLPGGKLDHIEVSPEALELALVREVYEEVGIRLGSLSYIESKTFAMDTGEMCLSICFLCQDFRGQGEIKSIEEVRKLQWLTWGEIIKNPATPPWTAQSITAAEKLVAKNS
jgi:8-oxo-dGTP diphosphatase